MTGANPIDGVIDDDIQQQTLQIGESPNLASLIDVDAFANFFEMGAKLCSLIVENIEEAEKSEGNAVDGTPTNKFESKAGAKDSYPTWNYDENDNLRGPATWPTGVSQSPIDLQLSRCRVIPLENNPLKFANYAQHIRGVFVNNGHSVQFLPHSQIDFPEIYGGFLDQNYRFIQYHYHWSQNGNFGSEHSIGGLFYSAELHLVHQGVEDPTKLAVLAIFLKFDDECRRHAHNSDIYNDSDQENDANVCRPASASSALVVDTIAFKQVTKCNEQYETKVCLSDKLPANFTFIRYAGSLSTPPCTENVTWTVFTDPVPITHTQLSALRSIRDHSGSVIKCNCRRTQNLNGRQTLLAL